jgi:2-polyprenyl-3-methyl-5-hydroxy-6-metoxy-1,4-benzoquinol methylase
MNHQEQKRVEKVSEWYLTDQLDFDKRLIQYRYQSLRPHLQGTEGLELGPAEGQMTQYLLSHFKRLTVVDASGELLAQINDAPNLVKVQSLFEEFVPPQAFDTIIMEHILEHVEEPISLVQRIKQWLAPGGKLLVGVPNGNSIHRLVAVKMGLLKYPCELNSRDHTLGHRRVYTPETLSRDLEAAGVQILESGGVFFKPVSNQQIQDNWTEEMIAGFYELGKDFPEHAAEIYAVCQSA